MSKSARICLGLLGVVGVGAGLATASVAQPHVQSPSRIIHGYADIGVPPSAQGASALQLATRSLHIPGVQEVLLAKVAGVQGVVIIKRDPAGRPQKIVTDYRITVIRTWSRATASRPAVLRVPGGSAEGTLERYEDAPLISVGGEYLIWDMAQPVAAAAGGSVPGYAVVPNVGDIASVSTDGHVNWAGKASQLPQLARAFVAAGAHQTDD